MSSPAIARWSILGGLSASILGIILTFQLGRIGDLRMGLTVLGNAANLSLAMILLGLLAALIGAVTWACRAPLIYLPLAGLSAGVVAFLLAELVTIDIHEPTAVLMFVIPACVVGCALILLVAAIRYLLSRRQHQH